MKPLELIKLWSDLQIFLNDPQLTDENKAMVCSEVLRSLPPTMVCTQSPQTRELVEQLIKKELEKHRGRKTSTDPKKEVEAKVRTGKRQEKDRGVGK